MRSIVFCGATALLVFSAAAQEDSLVECDSAGPVSSCADGSKAARTLNPVLIYGDRQQSDPGSYSVLGPDAVISLAADHPAELLNTLPGVNIQMNSGQEHLIAIRSPVLTGGAGQGSFLILENGVPTRSPAFGNVNSLIEPHHEVASAVEVVRGPGSAKFGSNAVHGLINVFLPQTAAGRAERGADLRVSVSTLQRYKGDGVVDLGQNTTAALSLQKDVGWRDNTGLDQQKVSIVSTRALGGWDATGWLSLQNMHQETAGFIQGPNVFRDRDIARTNPNPEAGRDARSARIALRLERPLAAGTLSVTPFARSQEMSFRQHFLPNRSFEKNGHTGGGVQLRWEDVVLSDRFSLSLGGDVDFATGFLKETQDDPFGFFPGDMRFPAGVHYDYDVDTQAYALWGEANWQVSDQLVVVAGLRGEVHDYDYTTDAPPGINGRFNVPEDRSDAFDLLTPKLGAVFTVNGDLDLYANYARGERAPQATDLYRLQSQQVAGEVDEETLDSFEIGVRGQVAGFVFDAAAYRLDKENFFFRDADGLNVPDGRTDHMGVELSLAGALWESSERTGRGLSLAGNVSWSDQTYDFNRIVGNASEVIRDGDPIDTAPEWLADLALTYSYDDRTDLALQLEYIGAYVTNPSGSQDYPGHTLTTVRASHAFSGTLEAFVLVRNLFDLEYADRADFAFGNSRFFPGEPLNATLGIRKRFP
ncbi:MAG: TonB-dependent receptor [Pseudomonadota bacterium]